MKTKICSRCKTEKEVTEFYKDSHTVDKLHSSCKICGNKYTRTRIHLKPGLVSVIYRNQRVNSKRRNNPPPNYTNRELRHWLYAQPKFHKLFDEWKSSGYKKSLSPSPDRLDDYAPYTLDNLQLMTWGENKKKGEIDKINGINNKGNVAVIATHKHTGETSEFHSLSSGARSTKATSSNICMCCKGIRNSAGGYKWNYK